MATSLPQPSASLLPYLQWPHAEASLKLSLFSSGATLLTNSYPFAVLDDTSPVSRLIEASFVTDTGCLLKKVFLQIQKDRYTLAYDELSPVTNLDIDNSWSRAFASLKDGGDSCSQPFLSAQVDSRGRPTPLSSLFFCRKQNLYFHPVCPSCGNPLQLCRNDQLLVRTGLHPYSTSLKRYLYCAVCSDYNQPEFYLYERDHTDPVTVRDRWSLMDQFRQIDESKDPEGTFPCVRCPEHEVCYGQDSSVRSRMIPFSFYPFFLLVSDAPTLSAPDFLSLISGATVEEIHARLNQCGNPGRAARLEDFMGTDTSVTLFPFNDDRSFLEILFLKLTFLSDVMQKRLMGSDVRNLALRADRIWVRIPSVSRLFPSFWNFEVEIVDEIIPVSSSGGTMSLSSDFFTYLGLFWFQTLLLNRDIDQKKILSAVRERLAQPPVADTAEGRSGLLRIISKPDNCFWIPESATVRSHWLPFWEQASALGDQLLDAARTNRLTGSEGEFIESLESLRSEIKSALFTVAPTGEVAVQEVRTLDESMVKGILSKLIDNARLEVQKSALLPQDDNDEDESMETVILSPRSPLLQSFTQPSGSSILDTYIRSAPSQAPIAPEIPSPQPADDGILETVLLAPAGRGRQNSPPQAITEVEQLLHKAPADTEQGAETDYLAETIVVMPRGGRVRPGFPRN